MICTRECVKARGIPLATAGGHQLTSRALVVAEAALALVLLLTYLGVIALLIGVSRIACWVPASRAARGDPSIKLRAETRISGPGSHAGLLVVMKQKLHVVPRLPESHS